MIDHKAVTPEEKHKVMTRLFELWLAHPEMRLAQLIWNVLGSDDPYYTEDFDFVQQLEDYYQANKS